MSNIFRVSHSKVKLWRKCHYAYYLRYIDKLRRKQKPRPLMFGSIIHEMWDAFINGDDPFKILKRLEREQGKTFRVLEEEYGDILNDARIIFSDYIEHWKENDKGKITYLRMRGKSSEHSFEVTIADGIVATGKIDNFARTSDKLRWLVERKTFSRLPNEDHRWRNLQSAVYIRINDMLGLPPVDGTLWDYIRSKSPTAPKMLKSGAIALKAIDTLPAKIEDFFQQQGVKRIATDAAGVRLMTMARKNRPTYFLRKTNPVKKRVVDILFGDFIASSKMMADTHGKLKDKNVDRHCDWCEFEPICRAELTGADADFVRKREFEVSPRAPEFEPDFEA